jgi:hypothetical protein
LEVFSFVYIYFVPVPEKDFIDQNNGEIDITFDLEEKDEIEGKKKRKIKVMMKNVVRFV